MFGLSSERAIEILRGKQKLIAQPLGIISGKSQRGGEHAGFVFAFFMDEIKRVVAEFGHVHEGLFSIWKFHAIKV